MNQCRLRHLLVISARAGLILVKSTMIALALHLLASHFHWHLFREAGGSVIQAASIAATREGITVELDRAQPSEYGLGEGWQPKVEVWCRTETRVVSLAQFR